jgi:hypothetical protein
VVPLPLPDLRDTTGVDLLALSPGSDGLVGDDPQNR